MNQIKEFNNKKVLITGGLGFIGSNLAHRLCELGAEVKIVDSLHPMCGGNQFNIKGIEDKVETLFFDVQEKGVMDSLIKGQGYLFNFVGINSHIDSMEDPYSDLEINCRSQFAILESCKKYNRDIKIVFLGSRSQYGKAKYLPVDENHSMEPMDINGINNITGEMYHLLYYKIYGIRCICFRLTNTYGPRHQMRNSKQGFLNWFIRLAMDGVTIPIYGDGSQLRDFNYIDDVIEAIILATASEKAVGEVFNLGSGKPINVFEVAKLVISLIGSGDYKFVDFPEDKRKIEVGNYYADFLKAKMILGWQPNVNLEDGLKRTINFYERYRDRYWQKQEVFI